MTMLDADADTERPPAEYPHHSWVEDPADDYWVASELRPDYLAAAARGVGAISKFTTLVEPTYPVTLPDGSRDWVPFEYQYWAHVQRRHDARMVAQARAHPRPVCAACGTTGNLYTMLKAVTVGAWSLTACTACAPGITVELRARELIDGTPRGELIRALAERITAE